MEELLISRDVLKDIYENNYNFHKAIKNRIPYNASDHNLANLVSSLVGSELRHHLLFVELVNAYASDNSRDNKYLLYLAMANHHFTHRLNGDEVLTYLKKQDIIADYSVLLSKTNAYDLLHLIAPNNDSLEFISYRFNTPINIIKMWQKNFHEGRTFRILKALSKGENNYIRVNNLLTNSAQVIAESNNNLETTDVENLLKSKNNSFATIKKLIEENKVFTTKYIYKSLLDKIIASYGQTNEFFVYSEKDQHLLMEAILQTNRTLGLNACLTNKDDNARILRLIRVNKLKNVNFFNSSSDSLHAYVTSKQDLIIAMPESSSFDLIKSNPDFFVNFDNKTIDKCIKHQLEVLDNLDEYLEDGGYLVYMINTLNKKESSNVIGTFLSKHPSYVYIESKQIFPFEDAGACFYYCVIKKNEENA